MAQPVVRRSINFVQQVVSDLGIRVRRKSHGGHREQLSLEFFMRAIWTKLPEEVERMIFREIVDQLTLDDYCSSPPNDRRRSKQKISSLCLMSRAWCRTIRPHIFKHLRLTSDFDSEVGFWELYSILNNPTSKWLTDHIHTIECRLSVALREPIFAAMLRHVRGLRELRFDSRYCPTGQALPLSWRQHAHSLRSLQSLHLSNCYFPTYSGLLRFLASLPSLQVVVLDYPRWGSERPLQWKPHICNSTFQQIQSITMRNARSHSTTSVPFWIFATASTRFQHSRRQQSRVDVSIPTPSPQLDIMKFAALLVNLDAAPERTWYEYVFQKEYSREGADSKFSRYRIQVLTRYIVDAYGFSLACDSSNSSGQRGLIYVVKLETRPSTIVSHGPRNQTQTWAVHRITFEDVFERWGRPYTISKSNHTRSRNIVADLLPAFPSLHVLEFKCGYPFLIEYRLQLLNAVREVLLDLPSWRLKDERTLEGGDFLKLEIVRQD